MDADQTVRYLWVLSSPDVNGDCVVGPITIHGPRVWEANKVGDPIIDTGRLFVSSIRGALWVMYLADEEEGAS